MCNSHRYGVSFLDTHLLLFFFLCLCLISIATVESKRTDGYRTTVRDRLKVRMLGVRDVEIDSCLVKLDGMGWDGMGWGKGREHSVCMRRNEGGLGWDHLATRVACAMSNIALSCNSITLLLND